MICRACGLQHPAGISQCSAVRRLLAVSHPEPAPVPTPAVVDNRRGDRHAKTEARAAYTRDLMRDGVRRCTGAVLGDAQRRS